MVKRAGTVHQHKAGAEDGERHDLSSASILDGNHEQHHKSDYRQDRAEQMSEAIDGLAERDSKFHLSKLHKRSAGGDRGHDLSRPPN